MTGNIRRRILLSFKILLIHISISNPDKITRCLMGMNIVTTTNI